MPEVHAQVGNEIEMSTEKSKMESNKMQTKVMKPSEPQTRRVVVFYIWKKSRKKVKKSKSSLLRGVNH